MESLIIAYDKNMHWIYPDLISVLSKKFHFLWNGPTVVNAYRKYQTKKKNSRPYTEKNNNNNNNNYSFTEWKREIFMTHGKFLPGGGALVIEVGYHPRKKLIRVVFQNQAMYARTSFRHRAKLEKGVCFWSYWKILVRNWRTD